MREIFSAAGFRGKNLETLSERVAPDLAREWSAWVARAKQSDQYRNPHGYAWTVLEAHPSAHPPALPGEAVAGSAEPMPIPPAEAFGIGLAGELWHGVVCEMRAVLDDAHFRWLLASRVVEYAQVDDALALTIFDGAHTLPRLREALERTASGISGKPCALSIVGGSD